MKAQNFFLGTFLILVFALVFFVPSINSLMLGVFSQSFNSSQQSILTNTLNETDNIHLEINATSERELVLDGSGDYIRNISSTTSFESTNARTISAWIKTTSTGTLSSSNSIVAIIANATPFTGFSLNIGRNTAGKLSYFSGAWKESTLTDYNSGEWIHVSVVHNGTNVAIYKNGVADGTFSDVSITNSQAPLFIGRERESENRYFNGSIDDVMLFNRALSPTEIANIYALNRSTYNGSKSGLVGEWNFDNHPSNYLDSSGNNNHGTAYGNATTQVDASYPQNSPYPNLVGYWNFDSDMANASNVSAPNKAYDLSNLNNDGLYVGNAFSSNISGIYDDALILDGNGDYVDAGSNLNLVNNFTWTAWVKPVSSGTDLIIFGSSSSRSSLKVSSAGKLVFRYYNAGLFDLLTSSSSIQPDRYYYVTVTKDSVNGSKLYINGTFEGNLSVTADIGAVSPFKTFLGWDAGSKYFNGSIDEVMIFDKALTQQEIIDIYNNQSRRFKDSGTIEGKQSTINSGYDLLELNLTKENNLNTNIQARVGQWNKDLGYKTENSTAFANFNGNGDYITLPANIGNNAEKLSVFTWIYPLMTGDKQGLLMKSNEYYFHFNGTNTALYLYNYSASGFGHFYSSNSIPLNQWSYVGFTYDSSVSANNTRLYVNGVASGVFTAKGVLANNTNAPQIGYYTSQKYFNGSIDEVMIFNKSLNSTEISNIYNLNRAEYNLSTSGLVSYYSFNTLSAQDDFGINHGKSYGNTFYSSINTSDSLNEGLVGYWPLDNTGLNDFSGNGKDGTGYGNVATGEGVYNNSGVFDGNGDYIASSAVISNQTRNGLTYSTWVRKTGATLSATPGIISGVGSETYFMYQNTSGLRVYAKNQTSAAQAVVCSNTLIADGNWHLASVTYDLATWRIYTDGSLTCSGTGIIGVLNASSVVGRIGSYTLNAATDFWNGSIDEVMIFNRSLSAMEIKELYLKGRANWNYTDYQTVSGNSASVPILTSTTNVCPQIKLNSDAPSFYSPFFFTTSNSTITGLDEINLPVTNVSLPINGTYTNNATLNFTINFSDQDTGIKNATLNMTNLNNSWLELDGNGDSVVIPTSSSLNLVGDVSISAWIKAAAVDGVRHEIFTKSSSLHYSMIIESFNKPRGYLYNGITWPTVTSSETISPNTWYYLTTTWDNTSKVFKIYVDGVSKGNATFPDFSIQNNSAYPAWIGGGSNKFNGSIDEVRIYNRSLSASEITEVYNSGILSNPNLNSTGLVAWYDFEGSSTIAIDKSGNGNNGTKQGDAKLTNSQEQTQTFARNTTSTNAGFVQSIAEGIWKWFWKIFDWSDNQVVTETYETIIDRTNASIEFLSPTPEEGEFKSSATINMTASDQDHVSLFLDWNNSLVGWWTFDSISGSTVIDSSGRGNSGTKQGDARVDVNGRMGDAMAFDGAGDYISRDSPAGLNITNNVSVSVWIKKITNGPYDLLAGYTDVGTANGYRLWSSPNKVLFSINGYNTNPATYNYVADNIWHHVVGINNGTHNMIYLDGVLGNITNTTSQINYSNVYLGMGYGTGWSYFNGSIDDVMIFNRALTQAEIVALYSNQSTKYLTITFANLAEGVSYPVKAYVQDRAGNINFTETRTIIGNTKPNIQNVLQNTYDNDTIDPLTNVTISVNVTDIDSNLQTVLLQWKNSTDSDWQENLIMETVGSNFSYVLTLPEYEGTITYRVWANDTEGGINFSSDYQISSYYDCSWNISTNDLGTIGGFNEDKSIGNLIITNTGDENYSDGCVIKYTIGYNKANILYPDFGLGYFQGTGIADESSISGFKINDNSLPNTITLSAGENQTVEVKSGFPQTSSVLDETPAFNVTANISDSVDGTITEVVQARVVVTPGAYLDSRIELPSSNYYRINLTNQVINLSAFVKNLVEPTNISDPSDSNLAYEVFFNWSIPSAISSLLEGNSSAVYPILNDTSEQFLNLTLNLTKSNMESITLGGIEYILNIYAGGSENSTENLLPINHAVGNILTDEVTISFVCYSVSDGICPLGCSYLSNTAGYDPDCSAPLTGGSSSGGGGGGGGGSGAGSFEKSEAQFELLRGADQEFQLPIENKLDSAKRDISITVTGTNSEYVTITPTVIEEILGKSSKNLTVKITAPSYFSQGKYLLKFNLEGTIDGSTEKKQFTETKFVTLYIVEVTRQTADGYLNNSERMIQEMNASGFYLKDVESYYSLMQSNYEEVNFLAVEDNYKLLNLIYSAAYESKALIDELYTSLDWAQKRGISTIETKKLLYVAETIYKRGDYLSAYKNLKDAQLTYALETKGEFNLLYEIKENPKETTGIFLVVLLLSFGGTVATKLSLNKKKLKMLDQEERLLLQLMRVIQSETFEKNKMSMEEYRESMSQYEDKLAKTINEKIRVQTRIANLMKVSGKRIALSQEKERLIDLMRQVQDKYLKRGEMETRVYENMFKIYNTRLAKVEEELLFMEAKSFIKGKNLPKEKSFRGEKR